MINCDNLSGDVWLDGSVRQGRIHAEERELLEMFGQPGVVINGYREWVLRFVRHDGKVVYATVYPSSVDDRGNNLRPGLYDVGGYGIDALYFVENFLGGRLAADAENFCAVA